MKKAIYTFKFDTMFIAYFKRFYFLFTLEILQKQYSFENNKKKY